MAAQSVAAAMPAEGDGSAAIAVDGSAASTESSPEVTAKVSFQKGFIF